MTKDEALRLALYTMEYTFACSKNQLTTKTKREYDQDLLMKAITAIKEALETKDEPVAWGMKKDGVILDVICPAEHDLEEGSYTVPLYTTTQRTWVGLKDDDEIPWDGVDAKSFAKAIEAKLKERNT